MAEEIFKVMSWNFLKLDRRNSSRITHTHTPTHITVKYLENKYEEKSFKVVRVNKKIIYKEHR